MFHVAVIGGQPHAVAAAAEYDVDVVLVHEQGQYEDTFARYCRSIVHGPITNGPALLDILLPMHARRPFDRVLSTSEDAAAATAYVAAALGLPGNSVRTAQTLKDKALTRTALAEHGLSPVRHQVVGQLSELMSFYDTTGETIVVKPVDGVASANVHVVTSAASATAAWTALTDAGLVRALAEEYLEGPAVSVETFSNEGRHVPLAMTEYQLNDSFVEVGISVPSRVALAHTELLRDLTARLLDAVGLVEGPSHTEFVLTSDGPRVLESHNRLAGGGVPELVRRAYGISPSRMFLTVPLGLQKLPDESPQPRGGAAIKFFAPHPGVLARIIGLDRLDVPVLRLRPGERIPGVARLMDLSEADIGVVVAVNEGDVVPRIRAGWDRRMGYVIANGTDGDDAVARAAQIAAQIQFDCA